MKNNRYKVFFTISFFYSTDKKKSVTKFFKSDIDFYTSGSAEELNDSNVLKKWQQYALKTNLNELNPPENFIESNVNTKKLITHRIVNLVNLTEVF
tara:strand:- start:658 stop:945 length:288 start_codon:yes stop_codon:yes gene_type:complete